MLKKIQYKDSEFSKLKLWIHDSDVSSLSVLHEVHDSHIVTDSHFLAGFVGKVKINEIGWDEDQPKRPKDSACSAGESFEYWEFPEPNYRR
jgi:hypothetical protein